MAEGGLVLCLQCPGVCGKGKPCLPHIDQTTVIMKETENKGDIHHLILYENPEVASLASRWACIIRAQWHKRDDSSQEYCGSVFFHTNQFLFILSLKGNLISGSNYLLPKKVKDLNFLPLQIDFGRKDSVHYFSTSWGVLELWLIEQCYLELQ